MKFSLVIATALAAAPMGANAQQTIAEIAGSITDFSTLVSLVDMAGLIPALDGGLNNITVFAPVNAAFEALPEDLVNNLMTPAWGAHLESILTSHILDTVVPSSAITEDITVTALSGEMLDVTAAPITIDGATVIDPFDVEASNGIIHTIDAVITPSWIDKDLPTVASGEPSVSTLVSLLVEAGLVDALSMPGPYTVFAPTDEAFAALGDATTKCVTENEDYLTKVLTYHVIEGLVPAAEVLTGKFATLEGGDLDIDAAALTVNGAKIIGPDALLANNGIAHTIDAVLVPESIAANITACVEAAEETDSSSSSFSLSAVAILVAGFTFF